MLDNNNNNDDDSNTVLNVLNMVKEADQSLAFSIEG